MKNLNLNSESKLSFNKKTIVKLNAADLYNIQGGSNAAFTDLGDDNGDISTGTLVKTIRTSGILGSSL